MNAYAICSLNFDVYANEFYIHFLAFFLGGLWTGSTDHRGTPKFPGRTVTLEPAEGEVCVCFHLLPPFLFYSVNDFNVKVYWSNGASLNPL